jgi:enoyl-CoA hydratase/carnithine racemase
LALACDLIVAARNSVFVMAYSNIALSPDGGGTWSLTRLLPRQLATELLLCGERISAERLHTMGVINRLSEPGQAMSMALDLTDNLNERAPNTLTSIKELISDADGSNLHQQLARERDHFVKNLHHPNAGIGIGAFLNKQKPTFE